MTRKSGVRTARVETAGRHARRAGREAVASLDENVFMVLLRAADVGVSDRD